MKFLKNYIGLKHDFISIIFYSYLKRSLSYLCLIKFIGNAGYKESLKEDEKNMIDVKSLKNCKGPKLYLQAEHLIHGGTKLLSKNVVNIFEKVLNP